MKEKLRVLRVLSFNVKVHRRRIMVYFGRIGKVKWPAAKFRSHGCSRYT